MTQEELSNEVRQKDANRLAEILYQFVVLVGYTFKDAITIVTFACIDFVMIFTKQCGGDPDAELKRFADYVKQISDNYEQSKQEKSNAS